MDVLHIGCDERLQYTAQTTVSGTVLGAGTCSYTLKTAAGTTLDSGSMPWDSVNECYSAVIDASITSGLEENVKYVVTITFSEAGYDDERKLYPYAAYRTE